MIYLDSAATTLQKPPQVVSAVASAMQTCASVGRGGHKPAMAAAEVVYHCRELSGALFDAAPEQVVFTMNATHALNIAIRSLIQPGDEVVVSGFEHNAVVRPLHALEARVTVAGRKLFAPEMALEEFARAITHHTKAVVCTHVSNVFGYVLPVEALASVCRERGVPLIVDASQSAGVLPVSLKQLDAAFIAMPGHKSLYGPQGTGLLLCGQRPEPLLYGGSGSASRSLEMPDFLPDRAEAGTHNVCGIAGLARGLEFVLQQGGERILRHECALRAKLAAKLEKIDGVRVFHNDRSQTGVLSFLIEGTDCEALAGFLGERGIAVRAGLHCAPLAHQSAGTLSSGTVRVSFSAFNRAAETERFVQVLKKFLRD